VQRAAAALDEVAGVIRKLEDRSRNCGVRISVWQLFGRLVRVERYEPVHLAEATSPMVVSYC
jgi:hypothetical protein